MFSESRLVGGCAGGSVPGSSGLTMRSKMPLTTLAAILLSAAFLSSRAYAQVLEIGPSGAVRTYDGPAVFTDNGVAPILRKRLAPARRRAVVDREGVVARDAVARFALARAAQAAALSPAFMEAVAWRESGFRPGARSRVGAIGEMQLMPSTARGLGVDPFDANDNLKGGATYLNLMMRRYNGDLVRALAAYNAGPGAVDRYHGVPPFKETQAYVAAVLDRLSQAVVPLAAVAGR